LGDPVTVILVSGSALVVMLATFAVALGRVAARADEEHERLTSRSLAVDGAEPARWLRDDYPGLAAAHSTIARDPSIAVPSSSRSVGTQRLPVSSSTSRLPRVWFMNLGNGAKP
jgi:hypothetical protein